MHFIVNFIVGNRMELIQLLLVITGCSAVGIYIVQERRKLRDAASLIILQINELQKGIREIKSYITNRGPNFTAFYESLPLIDTNYWEEYKHLFVNKMDRESYSCIDEFYKHVIGIKEQQELLKNLQRNHFFQMQQMISSYEYMCASETFKEMAVTYNNSNYDMRYFWTYYPNRRQPFIDIVKQSETFTFYSPVQIYETMQSILDQCALLEVTGTEGYRKLYKIAKIDK